MKKFFDTLTLVYQHLKLMAKEKVPILEDIFLQVDHECLGAALFSVAHYLGLKHMQIIIQKLF